MNDFGEFIIVCIGGLVVMAIIGLCCILFNIAFIENIPSIVKVNGKIVYEGISAGYDVGSSGANTTVTVMKKPLYFLPKAYYVSKEVEVINKEIQ